MWTNSCLGIASLLIVVLYVWFPFSGSVVEVCIAARSNLHRETSTKFACFFLCV